MVRKDCDTTTVQHHVSMTRLSVFAGAVLCLCAAPAAGDAVVLWPQATVTAADITLADVARLDGFSSAESLVMGGIVVAPAPAPGSSANIGLADIRMALRSNGANLAHLSLKGALTCTVSRLPCAETIISFQSCGLNHLATSSAFGLTTQPRPCVS